ncbi:hypothetical protein Z517_05822 [Fonsecaea pedrosoi CBS 271.37]|uniref:Mitochondrial thiamine pyrophosphate carrier 1 n=1 Tax=Fonsecaea pedrosoi CBS 271.37 TaxID=1442368 RepID=A0A0D2GL02_9EURO|nr:uncharacterized protein Z517_05822 [Fonsecaea pedrosoi CBS 271.37]KIW79210.1 hypothetical protein Z517_05822 [Fonsecaea pedrosoi CBS 271.37]
MSPPAMAPALAAGGKSYKTESGTARLLGSGSAGVAELLVFHPVDTVAKRLMNNPTRVSSLSALNSVVFRQAATAPVLTKFTSLFPGLGYAAGYKISQRIYKYGGQPFVRDYLTQHHGQDFDKAFGKGTGKAMLNATAGSLIGIGEAVLLLPLDLLKIKMQLRQPGGPSQGFFSIVKEEGFFGLYRGIGWTIARNAPGSFALFGGSSFTKEYLFKLEDYNAATWGQNFVASVAGAASSLTVSAPLDVVKTRIQGAAFGNSGFQIVAGMVKNEGITSFFKGLVPKMLMTGPKLVFSFWL